MINNEHFIYSYIYMYMYTVKDILWTLMNLKWCGNENYIIIAIQNYYVFIGYTV